MTRAHGRLLQPSHHWLVSPAPKRVQTAADGCATRRGTPRERRQGKRTNAPPLRRFGAAAALAWVRSGLERRLAHPLPQLRALLELGVDVDSLDEHQATPLHVAVRAYADPLPS